MFDVLHWAAMVTSSLYSDRLRLLKHLSCLNVGSWHETFRHGIQVWNIQPAYSEKHYTEYWTVSTPSPSPDLVQPSPWSVSISQRSSPSSRGMLPSEAAIISEINKIFTDWWDLTFKWIEGSTFPKDWKRLWIEKFIVAVDILGSKLYIKIIFLLIFLISPENFLQGRPGTDVSYQDRTPDYWKTC